MPVMTPQFDEAVVDFLRDPESRVDPYPFYRRMREVDPVLHSPGLDMWIVTGYDETREVLRETRYSTAPRHAKGFRGVGELSRARRGISQQVLYAEPPEHPRLRGLINRTFLPRAMERRRDEIGAMVDAALDVMNGRDEVEFMSEVAAKVPMLITCGLLGIPESEAPRLLHWTEGYLALLEPDATPDVEEAGGRVFDEFAAFVAPLIGERLAGPDPGDDLLGELVAAERDGQLTREELENYALILMVGAHETTAGMLTNGVITLLAHEGAWQALAADPDLAPGAVEELLRFESPSRNAVPRYSSEDLEAGGHVIPAGEKIVCILGAANRDPRIFEEPERFDMTRSPNRHIGFGFGAHACVGAPLARIELQESFRRLPARFPDIALAGPVAWRPSWTLRIPLALRLSTGR
jgi:cytochrome P450